MKEPKVGDKMYVGTSMSISNGSSDVAGGLVTISKVEWSDRLPKDHINACFIEFEELPGHGYNYKILLEKQDKLSQDYAGKVGHPDPDIDTPWIQKGDIVNGKEWLGKDIW